MRRAGFTMIELLIVLAIITILMSISWVVYGMAVENARSAATRVTLVDIQQAVDAKTAALAKNNVKGLAQRFQASYAQGGNPSPNATISERIAEILVRKNIYKEAMPTRLEDMWGFDVTPGTADDSPLWAIWKRKYQGLAVSDSTPRPAGYRRDLENSELLHLFLTEGASFGDAKVNIDRITPRHIADANNNGLPEFVDDWGSPVRFYGWTHRLTRPGGNGAPIDQTLFNQTAHLLSTAQTLPSSPSPYPANIYNHALNQDPDDPTGALSDRIINAGLMTSSWQLDLDAGPGTNIVTCPAFDETNYHALDTRGISLVISAGPDKVLGLVEPTDAANQAGRTAEPLAQTDPSKLDAVFDNITTRH